MRSCLLCALVRSRPVECYLHVSSVMQEHGVIYHVYVYGHKYGQK